MQVWFRKLWSLSLVPPKDIIEVWELIEMESPEWDEEVEDQGAAEQLNNSVQLFKVSSSLEKLFVLQ
jgi:hypothetical protein